MLFTSASELRFYFPTHAIDTLDPFMGVIDNSEHDFLQEKLGTPLYNALCQWYTQNGGVGSGSAAAIDTKGLPYYNRLLLLAQRCIAYDAFSRAIEFGIVSPNNAGINVPTSDDYGKVDLAAVEKFRQRCITEAHAAVNRLLQTLEDWCQEAAADSVSAGSPSGSVTSGSNSVSAGSPSGSVPSGSPAGSVLSGSPAEREEIVTLWRQSRYFYLAAGMLIPSARVLQEYLNIYDSREKFIQMLPDLRFLQEEILAPAIGEDLCAYLVKFSASGSVSAASPADSVPSGSPAADSVSAGSPSGNVDSVPSGSPADSVPSGSPAGKGTSEANSSLKKSRKYLAAALENRTLVLKTDKVRRQQAHDEAVRLLASLQQYIADHQDAFPEAVIKTSPLYTPPPATSVPSGSPSGRPECPAVLPQEKEYQNNRRGSSLFATPFLN